jgi:mycofactocin precursor
MTNSESTDAAVVAGPQPEEPIEEALIEDDLIIEEISIDGMCGVY